MIGRTLDDAAGEAFDKVASLLGLPYLGGIKFLIVPDPFVRATMLRTRQVDVVETPDFKDVAKLKTEKGIIVQQVVAHAWDGILFSALASKPHPFMDARVRRPRKAENQRRRCAQAGRRG